MNKTSKIPSLSSERMKIVSGYESLPKGSISMKAYADKNGVSYRSFIEWRALYRQIKKLDNSGFQEFNKYYRKKFRDILEEFTKENILPNSSQCEAMCKMLVLRRRIRYNESIIDIDSLELYISHYVAKILDANLYG